MARKRTYVQSLPDYVHAQLLTTQGMAIVADEPGTTRDLLEVGLDLAGYPATMVDTAGIRDTESRVEREGVRRARARASGADIVVLLADGLDAASALPAPDGAELLRVRTKADLIDSSAERDSVRTRFDHTLSALTGAGLPEFLADLSARVASRLGSGEPQMITRNRHRVALEACAAAIDAAQASRGAGPEIVAEELRRASDALGRVTGRVDVEDVLGAIFGEFCIGK